jgi:ABC-type multidrug transport system fused ATPase/permease subunit
MNNEDLTNLLLRLWRHLIPRRRRQFLLLMVLMLVAALVEVISLGAVIPFLGILVAPDRVFNHPWIAEIVKIWGVKSSAELALPLTVAFAAAGLTAGSIRLLMLWLSTRLACSSGADLSFEAYRRTLYQPYQVHVSRNSSEIISGITNKVNSVVFLILLPAMTLIISFVLLVAIILTLIIIDPLVAFVAAFGFAIIYALITWLSRRELRRNSKQISFEQTRVVKVLQEGLGGIRDVLLDGSQPLYCNAYRLADRPLRQAQGGNSVISVAPRYMIEALAMTLIAIFAFMLSQKTGGISSAIPVLGALALGAQRLMPTLQQIYSSWAHISGNQATLSDFILLLDQPLPAEALTPPPAPLNFQGNIEFKNTSFRYSSNNLWVLRDLNLVIPKGARVGLVGSTGSGKSTALDLLMGLLTPTEGQILVDGEPIAGELCRAWQQNIAHVPQSIYLADASIAENIAFGVPSNAINLDRVRNAARQAQIADFIEGNPEGYSAFVGERGIRLSGGQRQRIGIARALYKQASVLVLDEATSALDNLTEHSVMRAIQELRRDLTVILIAHRLSTLECCDFIVELSYGRVVFQGTYDQLLKRSPGFTRTTDD